MTPVQNVQTITAAYEAFGRQDIPAVLAAFDPQIAWYVPDELPIGGTFHGPDGVLTFFQSLPGYFDELHVEPESFIASGDQVVAVGRHRGRVNGNPFEIGFCMVWTMKDGKAIGFREYNDSGKLLRIAEGQSVMSTEENKAVVRRFMNDVISAGNPGAADTVCSDDFHWHGGSVGECHTLNEFKAVLVPFFAGFPDLSVSDMDMMAEGDKVVTRYTWQGTQQGEFFGTPPTGTRVTVNGISIYRIADGKLAEEWWQEDVLGLMQQLGVIPQQEPAQG